MEKTDTEALKAYGIVHCHPITGVYVRDNQNGSYTVFRPTTSYTHAYSDSTYDDLSLAIARCDYLARKRETT